MRKAPGPGRPDPADSLGHEVDDRDGFPVQLEGTGLHPAHIEEIGHQAVEPVDLILDEMEQLLTFLAPEIGVGVREGRGRDLDGGQRGAQIMGDGAHQRLLETVDLLEELGAHGLFAQLGPFHGQGDVIGEGGRADRGRDG